MFEQVYLLQSHSVFAFGTGSIDQVLRISISMLDSAIHQYTFLVDRLDNI